MTRGCLCFVCSLLLVTSCACNRSPVTPSGDRASKASTTGSQVNVSAAVPSAEHEALTDAQLIGGVRTFCGDCHAMPQPRSFSRQHWRREVQRGFDFYFASGRADLAVPRAADVTRYFTALAPESMTLAAPQPLDREAQQRYRVQSVAQPEALSEATAGASIVDIDWGPAIGRRLMSADMRSGAILASSFDGDRFGVSQVVAKLNNPCRLVQCDLDGTGRPGLLVADLGSFLPADHELGRVVWLRRAEQVDVTGKMDLAFTSEVILDHCGRVADAQPADLDNDGDLDVVVADFGWHETGRLLWLERVAPGPVSSSSFAAHVLDERPGCLEVSIIDLNEDGHLDIVALIAQEFETIVAILGDGAGGFSTKPTPLFAADDPAYGSSGMVLCDLDRDGDSDIVYTNGDSFDSFEAKPYHAVHWLENHGELKFEPHELMALPGVHRALPGDLDADGDLDIVAAAFLPRDLKTAFEEGDPIALVWLENDGQQTFRVRPLQVGACLHPAVCLADFNNDTRLDIAAANFYEDAAEPRPTADVFLSKDRNASDEAAGNHGQPSPW